MRNPLYTRCTISMIRNLLWVSAKTGVQDQDFRSRTLYEKNPTHHNTQDSRLYQLAFAKIPIIKNLAGLNSRAISCQPKKVNTSQIDSGCTSQWSLQEPNCTPCLDFYKHLGISTFWTYVIMNLAFSAHSTRPPCRFFMLWSPSCRALETLPSGADYFHSCRRLFG